MDAELQALAEVSLPVLLSSRSAFQLKAALTTCCARPLGCALVTTLIILCQTAELGSNSREAWLLQDVGEERDNEASADASAGHDTKVKRDLRLQKGSRGSTNPNFTLCSLSCSAPSQPVCGPF